MSGWHGDTRPSPTVSATWSTMCLLLYVYGIIRKGLIVQGQIVSVQKCCRFFYAFLFLRFSHFHQFSCSRELRIVFFLRAFLSQIDYVRLEQTCICSGYIVWYLDTLLLSCVDFKTNMSNPSLNCLLNQLFFDLYNMSQVLICGLVMNMVFQSCITYGYLGVWWSK